MYNPMVYKMTLCKEITLYPEKIIYIRIDYIGLSSKRDFIITRTYLTVFNTILNIKTPRIVILANFIKKTFKIGQKTYLSIIYKYTDIIFIFIDIIHVFVVLFAAIVTVFNIKSFLPI